MAKTSSDPRQRLLDAGLKLFANRGYAGTAVQDITEEAKVTKPTLYYYFENKEGLFQALVDQAMDERLHLMQKAAPPGKPTVDQLTDIIATLTDFARRQPDLLRITFAIAFAADGEYPTGFKKHAKMRASFEFIAEIISAGIERGVLNRNYDVMELTQSYFHLVQHSIAITIIEPKFRKLKPPIPLPPRMEPKRVVELFLGGAANPKAAMANGNHANTVARRSTATRRTTRALAIISGLGLSLLSVNAQTTNSAPTNAAPTQATLDTNAPPVMPDVRPIPLAVKASHPELATISPIEQNAKNPHALDLQTCFQLTAIRDDSLKISMEDIEIARAQLSESIAALWPTFTANNQQQFLHYLGPSQGFTILGNSTIEGNRNYTSQSHVQMSYTHPQRRPELEQCRRQRARGRGQARDAGARLPDDLPGCRAGVLQRAGVRRRHEHPGRPDRCLARPGR